METTIPEAISLLAGIAGLPPQLLLIAHFALERDLLNDDLRRLNSIFLLLFLVIFTATGANVTLTGLSVFTNLGQELHIFAVLRTAAVNVAMLIASWLIYFFYKTLQKVIN